LTLAGFAPRSLEQALWQGGYPPLHDRRIEPGDWFPNYVATYLERDVRQMLAVRDLAVFQRFVKMCAARSGQLLNLSSLAADCGITHVTAREWLSVLEASYLVVLLRPYHRNYGKRLVKTPKLYFLDPGLAAWLLGIRDAESLMAHAQRGALFETLVISEILKHEFNAGRTGELYFWRDHAGHEVDLLMPTGNRLQPIEIKSGSTFSPDWPAQARRWMAWAGDEALRPIIVYGGSGRYAREGCRVVGWRDLALPAAEPRKHEP
jgi:predicted AAA+ superfamily ATPase